MCMPRICLVQFRMCNAARKLTSRSDLRAPDNLVRAVSVECLFPELMTLQVYYALDLFLIMISQTTNIEMV